uniref:Large ribosomal subunit protein uL3m n=1 Tax=Ascaris suum TaxID=6253 RepID=F1L8Z6_ASCSU
MVLVGSVLGTVNCWQCVQIRGRRRTLTPPPWIPQKEERIFEQLEPETEELLRQVIEQEKSGYIPSWRSRDESPLREELVSNVKAGEGNEWTPNSKRVGLLARKLGMLPQWLNNGTRVLCTMLEFPENCVVSAIDPETWYRKSIVGKKKAFGIQGPMWKVTVGAVNADPSKFTHVYRDIFMRQGLPVKQHLGSFVVTEDAVVAPGTPLHVCHFSVGQYIAVTGRTIDWGFQGGMHRWGMKGMPANRTTKSHRRIGSIGSTGDARVWPGKRMPGHMGYEWVTTSGLEVLRINPGKQVMYIKGCVPGEVGEILLVKDCLQPSKRVKNPPFPTFFPPDQTADSSKEAPEEAEVPAAPNAPVVAPNGEIFASKLFRFSSPSIVFTEEHETKLPGRDKTRAKIAKGS